MASFTLPLNWQEDYFTSIDFTDVEEVYGKLREDFLGGGKSSMAQAEPSRRDVARAVREAHSRGVKFNYLLNTTCIGNREFTRSGYRKIRAMLDWLSEIGVDSVTLGLPFLVQVVKCHYPQLKVNISTQADIDSLEKARYWEDLGADLLTLSHVGANRNFEQIERITSHCSCRTQLIANMLCKRGCPFVTLHGNFNAHASQTWAKTNRYNLDYYFVSCLAESFCDPVQVIKSNWIRPEDLPFYEALGIDRFKIAERGMKTSALAFIISAYQQGRYEGNLMDLIPSTSKYVFAEPQNIAHTMKELLRVSFVDVFKMRQTIQKALELRNSPHYFKSSGMYIDNRKLDGAMEVFRQKNCSQTVCEDCGYCQQLADQAVTLLGEPGQLQKDTAVFHELVDGLVKGTYF